MESSTKDLQEPLLCAMDTDNSTTSSAAVIYDTTTPSSTTTPPRSPTREGPVWMMCGFPMDAERVETWHRGLAASFMTLMLWIQFHVACGVPNNNNNTSGVQMDASLVVQIVSFGLAGVLFRASLDGTEPTTVQLWPELTTDFLLFVILLGYSAEAVWLMNLLTLSQSLHAAWNFYDQLQQQQQQTAHDHHHPLDRTLHMRGCRPLRPPLGEFRKLDEYDSDVEDDIVDDESAKTSTTAVTV